MVKKQNKRNRKRHNNKGSRSKRTKATNINASTKYDTCKEKISTFGGLLAMIKFLDLMNFQEILNLNIAPLTVNPIWVTIKRWLAY